MSSPPPNLSCGVCRHKVDNCCGACSCNKCDEGYFVHSRCALRKDLWDGEELEGKPEEIEIVHDPFETIADGIILHFSHRHHLKLEISRVYDEDKYCQGCVLPIFEGNYYSCVDDHCDFILHERCVNAPRKIRHPLHARPLTLKVVTNEFYDNRGFFYCSACQRVSNGFIYEDSSEEKFFWLDLQCALISEPFEYEGHDHPLFLALTPDEERGATRQICHDYSCGKSRKLNCIECDFIICFECATLPYKAKYKHDNHSHQPDWCEACEKKIVHPKEGGLYACDEYCCTTPVPVHICLSPKAH
ncbi:Cysteine/Histidine-rich C1 domain family protein [Raphanus sativus]|nr:Cysteine/Histidine-rich C1 domain family protein [Raphanus sativus]